MKSAILSAFVFLVLFSFSAISKAQTIVQVFDDPAEWINKSGTFIMWINETSMERQTYYSSESKNSKAMDGYTLSVSDGRKSITDADRWGNRFTLLSPPKINVFMDKDLGRMFKERVNGTARVSATFTIKEVEVYELGKKRKYYVAHIRGIK
jgi:hypothetical protein